MIVDIPVRTVSEMNQRQHWTKRADRAKQQRGLSKLLLGSKFGYFIRFPWVGAIVTLTRVAPSKKGMDDDNLRGALKSCRDGVADWLGIEDNDPRVEWKYAQQRGEKKQYAVRVEVEKV